ncbi:hypothetical protein GCM10010531_06970 [Blastococcus jejuensis]|uniref:Tissue inhibitor of metalloproteinase n=2 Tax=Blastococcus jejuensis TaxID=351224 RepID=A0ABP6NTS2_9ACTN
MVTLLLTALLAVAGLLVAAPAQACSCAEATTAQHFADADAVFTGSLLSRDVDHPDWPVIGSGDPALLVFTAHVVFKGEVREAQGVVTASSSASCGLELSGKGPFVVFATSDPDLPDGQYRAGLCGGTAELDPLVVGELADLTNLTTSTGAPGGLPLEGEAGTEQPGGPDLLLLGLGAAVVLAVGLGSAWLLRRRRGA